MKLDFGFVPFPREIWEKPLDLTTGEFRLLGWFLYRLKFGIEQATYTDIQILRGAEDLPGLNLSRSNFKAARDRLVAIGYLDASATGKPGEWTYRLLISKEKPKVPETGNKVPETSTCSTDGLYELVPDSGTCNTNKVLQRTDKKKQGAFVLPEWVSTASWDGFVDMRSQSKFPLTLRAKELTIGDLERLKADGYDPNACLDLSVKNGWRGVFAPKSNGSGTSNAGTKLVPLSHRVAAGGM